MSDNKALSYLNNAVRTISVLGFNDKDQAGLPVQSLVSQVSEFGPDQAMSIAMVLSHQGTFNEVVRNEITGMDIANRYELITTSFTSIREDTRKQLQFIEDGRLGFMDKLSMKWSDMRKGTVPQRFDKIKQVYIDVSKSLRDQIDRETNIIGAYADYRLAMKDAEIQAHQMLEVATGVLAESVQSLEKAQHDLDAKKDTATDQDRSRLEMRRDEVMRSHQLVSERFQIAKDLADQLRVAYNASEFVFARLQQTSQVKKRLYDQAVVFFTTNEIVFTGQAAAFNSTQGLREGAQTLEAMKDGMNKGLEELASMGGSVLEQGLRAGYGPGIKADSIRKLIDSVVDFQESSLTLINELRVEATENAAEVARIAEDGKQRFAQLLTRQVPVA